MADNSDDKVIKILSACRQGASKYQLLRTAGIGASGLPDLLADLFESGFLVKGVSSCGSEIYITTFQGKERLMHLALFNRCRYYV